MPDPVTCITFGKFGQEENALIMISSSTRNHFCVATIVLFRYLILKQNKCLMVITINLLKLLLGGKMDIKLLKRTATFDLCIRPTLTTHIRGNLSIPKRSNVFIEQTLREREHCKGKYLKKDSVRI